MRIAGNLPRLPQRLMVNGETRKLRRLLEL